MWAYGSESCGLALSLDEIEPPEMRNKTLTELGIKSGDVVGPHPTRQQEKAFLEDAPQQLAYAIEMGHTLPLSEAEVDSLKQGTMLNRHIAAWKSLDSDQDREVWRGSVGVCKRRMDDGMSTKECSKAPVADKRADLKAARFRPVRPGCVPANATRQGGTPGGGARVNIKINPAMRGARLFLQVARGYFLLLQDLEVFDDDDDDDDDVQ